MSSEIVRTNSEALRIIANAVRAFSANQTAVMDEYLAVIRGIADAWDDEQFQSICNEINALSGRLSELTDHLAPFPRYLVDLACILESKAAPK